MAKTLVFIRSSLFLLGLVCVTPVYVPFAALGLWLPPHARYRWVTQWTHGVLWWLRITCGLKFVVKGRENIPVGASVIMAKHQSAWETLALQQIFPPQVWVLKRELLRIPFFGWGLALLSPIAIDRAAAKEALNQLVQQGKSRLQQGFWVVIFPEGTRVPFGNRGKYRAGGAWLATQAQVPVVPVAHNAGAFWARNAFLKYPGTITVSIGQALHSTDYDHNPARLVRAAEAWIEAECESLGGRV